MTSLLAACIALYLLTELLLTVILPTLTKVVTEGIKAPSTVPDGETLLWLPTTAQDVPQVTVASQTGILQYLASLSDDEFQQWLTRA